ncbi:Ser/Thr protein phosphatase [Blastomyces gilchristii SLH14081]|uniref:Ser/Thr protein phosphatase n=1 Tax=Blastomyces gilchristii (strain SLH14081) TaxID=559298 RepID=A0A179V429_BLAGS|nr:Ser/Thr protein phosphatase [Blastomyces gilchristii SLH14081]OAT14111.1 Ser/Thr protein phosphatase [Blastomyces gilchristii SLH14081]
MHSLFLALLGLSGSALSAQPAAPNPIPAPMRNLTFGQLNFLHTTDTHGWLAGHLREASYAADWGDYISFANHIREKVEAEGHDLLLIDTGDRIEGNGLYDSSEPKGLYTADIFKQQRIDVICSGNHELYQKNSSVDEYLITVPNFKGNYLASNIDITNPHSGERVPLAPRFKKFTTEKQGIRIVAFGFLFDFKQNYNNTVVQLVEDTVKEQWFQDAIRDKEVDLFLVIGHVPAESKEFLAIYKAIRGMHWDTPIQFFGGHHHIRDYIKYDEKAYGMASGRFMETIGFASISGLSTGNKKSPSAAATPSFTRKYIDNNLWSFYHHTGLNETTFLQNMARKFQNDRRGSPRPKPRPHLRLLAQRPVDVARAIPAQRKYIFLARDAGFAGQLSSQHYALTRPGPFTQDSAYILSPFISGFRYAKDVPYSKAKQVLEVLNRQMKILAAMPQSTVSASSFLSPPEQQRIAHDVIVNDDGNGRHHAGKIQLSAPGQIPLSSPRNDDDNDDDDDNKKPILTDIPGYTTKDDAGDDGDDTIHSPINFYRMPNCFSALIPPSASSSPSSSPSWSTSTDVKAHTADPETVDLVYVDFIEPWMDLAFQYVGHAIDIRRDTEVILAGETLTTIIVRWVEENWKCK